MGWNIIFELNDLRSAVIQYSLEELCNHSKYCSTHCSKENNQNINICF